MLTLALAVHDGPRFLVGYRDPKSMTASRRNLCNCCVADTEPGDFKNLLFISTEGSNDDRSWMRHVGVK